MVYRDTAVFDEGVLGVVQLGGSVSICVVGNLYTDYSEIGPHLGLRLVVMKYLTVIVPYWDPRELLMTGNQVQVGSVCSYPLPVVIETVDFLVRERNSADALTPAIVAVLILVNIVTEMDNVIY